MKYDRPLPPPMRHALHGGEKVRVKVELLFEDDFVLKSGSEGRALHPGSQAATWVVYFPAFRTQRVIPEWDLQVVSKKSH